MRKIFASLLTIVVIISVVAPATSVNAMCAIQVPLIGTVTSITNQGATTKINIDHRGKYDASLLPVDRTDIQAYQNFVKAYLQNADVVPPNLRAQESSLAPQGYTSWEDYYSQNFTYISVPTDALARATYEMGDIVVLGPPGGAACTQLGFTGFFTKDGAIRSAIATDNGFLAYAFGGEGLSLSAGTDYACTQETGTKCQVPITYTLRGVSNVLKPGESKSLSGQQFSSVSLISSTHTTLPQGLMVEDFSPRALLHVLTFRVPTPTTTPVTTSNPDSNTTPVSPNTGEVFSAVPKNGPASLGVTFSASVSNGDMYTLDFGDKQSPATVRCATAPTSTSTCQLPPVGHVYTTPGSYRATLTDTITLCAATSTKCTSANQYRTVGDATITIVPAQPKQSFKVFPRSGGAPLNVDFYGPSDSNTYSIDFGDGGPPEKYWGPKTVTSCKVGTGGPAGCVVLTHVYMQDGNYIARLSKNTSLIATASLTVNSTGLGTNADLPTADCPVIKRTLTRGSRGNDVTALQEYFISVGIMPLDSASGYYGARTRDAVSTWQSERGLDMTGVVGRLTRAALANCQQ